jgi:hypothetical protein
MTEDLINATNYLLTNLSNVTDEYDHEPPSLTYVVSLSILLSLIAVTTLVGNLLVVIAVLTTRSLSTVTNYFIMSLAVADMLVAVFVLPIAIYMVIYSHTWIFGSIICDLWSISDMFFCTASILNLCCISLDRYFAITRPLEYTQKRSPKLARCMIAVVWFASLLISLPPIIGWRDPERHTDSDTCFLNRLLSYRIYSSMGSFYLPALVMIFVYARIFKVIHERENGMLNVDNNQYMRAQRGGTFISLENSRMRHSSKVLSKSLTSSCISQNLRRTPIRFLQKPDAICEADDEVPSEELKKNNEIRMDSRLTGTMIVNIEEDKQSKAAFNLKNSRYSNESPSPSYCEIKNDSKRDSIQVEKPSAKKSFISNSTNGVTNKDSPNTQDDKKYEKSTTRDTTNLQSTASDEPRTPRPSHAKLSNLSNRYQEHKRLLIESKAAKTLGIVVGGFIVCWLPFFVLYILESVCPKCSSVLLYNILTWLGYLNSVINPFIYAFYSKQFRFAFYRLTLGKCQCLTKVLKTKSTKQKYDNNSSFQNLRNNIGSLMNSRYQ